MAPGETKPPVVIAVDDEAENLDYIVRSLVPFEVHPFLDPQKALAAAQEMTVDSLIVDYRMPNLSGLDLVRLYRYGGGDAAVLLVTAYPDLDELLYAEQISLLYRIVPKPFQPTYIREQVELVIAETRFRRNLKGRRRHVRVSVTIEAELLVDGHAHAVAVSNISLGGARVTAGHELKMQSGGTLRLTHDDRPLEVECRVIHSNDEAIGLAFEGMSDETKRRLGEAIFEHTYERSDRRQRPRID